MSYYRYPEAKRINESLNYRQRLETFESTNLRREYPYTPSELINRWAASGFFCVSRGDFSVIKCVSCGILLRSWSLDDFPDIVHARFSPRCEKIVKNRGIEFVKQCTNYEIPNPRGHMVDLTPYTTSKSGNDEL